MRAHGRDAPQALHDCVQVSQRLGRDPFLTLHGGGNTSAKTDDVLYVKASGHNLGTIDQSGFAILRRQPLYGLMHRTKLSDIDMVDEFRKALVHDTPTDPSIETLLHNLLPHTSVLHTHADAIVTLTNTTRGRELTQSVLGDDVLIVDYHMPGFDLAVAVRDMLEERKSPPDSGIVLMHHGLFTFGASADEAYRRHQILIKKASTFITAETGITFKEDQRREILTSLEDGHRASRRLRQIAESVSREADNDYVAEARTSNAVQAFITRDDLASITQRGPATLEHVIHTKRVPLIDNDIAGYTHAYRDYFERNASRVDRSLTMLDPVPRVILDLEIGLITTGHTLTDARIAGDIYRHTMRIIEASEKLGGYATVSESQAFDIEYWELEQRKLNSGISRTHPR